MKLYGHITPFETAIQSIELSAQKKVIIQQRYILLIQDLKSRTHRLTILFQVSRGVITVGSLIVPALLSIQYTTATNDQSITMYWVTWAISLCVTICNGLLTLFKLDKHYYHLHTVFEHLTSEGWQYIELTGKYSGFNTPNVRPTHENQFVYFCHSVEKIRMKQIEEEYYKLTETASHPTNQQGPLTNQDHPSLLPPTPLKTYMDTIPPEIAQAVKQQLSRPIVEDAGGQEDTKSEENGPEKSVSVSFNLPK